MANMWQSPPPPPPRGAELHKIKLCCEIPPPPGGTDVFYPRLQAFAKEPLVRISKQTLFIVQVCNR